MSCGRRPRSTPSEGLFDLLAGYLSELEETGAIRSFDVGGELGGKYSWVEFSFELVRTKKELQDPNLAFDRARAIVRSATKKLIRIRKVPKPKQPIRIAWQGANEIAAAHVLLEVHPFEEVRGNEILASLDTQNRPLMAGFECPMRRSSPQRKSPMGAKDFSRSWW